MTHKQKKNLARIAASAALLAAAYTISHFTDNPRLVLAAYLASYALIGFDVLLRAVVNIAHGEVFDENFLMGIATIGAFAVRDYPEAVAVMLFYQVGELFQSIAVGRSRRSIAKLMDIRPDHANVLRDGAEITVAPEEVGGGETIVIRPGERIPLDGVICEGDTTFDMSALTGESLPIERRSGENATSGAVNGSGLIRVRVTGVYSESTVARILALVESSADKKAKTENFITRFARIYTPCVVGAALLLAVAPPLFFGGAWGEWIKRALIFLVISCPCALVVSVPLSFFGGIGGAAREGILIKGSNYLEALSRVKTVVFDKTGTLTKGSFSVSAIHPSLQSESELLDIAALAESYSGHPIARSIVRAHGAHIERSRVSEINELPGLGVEAIIDSRRVYAGNSALMDKAGVGWKPCTHAGTIVHISIDGEYVGHIVISDEVKPDSADALLALKSAGVSKTVMLTGDSEAVGREVGEALGLDEIRTQLLPDGKVAAIEELLAAKPPKSTLAFVGDGINDAPVIALADVGVAMGALGSDAAIEAADVVLTDDKPSKVARAIGLSRRTMRIVRQNIIFSLAVKCAVLALGALGIADMWIAVFADVGVMVLAISNAARALYTKIA